MLRLTCGLLAGQHGSFELVGDESLTLRPHERVAEPLRRMGAQVETTDGHAPVRITGGELQPISYELPGRERAGEVGDPDRRPLSRTTARRR